MNQDIEHRRRARRWVSPILVGCLLAAAPVTVQAATHKPTAHALAKHKKKKHPKVLRGPRGFTGPAGPTGATGPVGPPGPFPTVLPAGVTVRGVFNIGGTAAAGNALVTSDASWFWPLSATPAVHIITSGGPANPACPGTAANPTAQSGNVCIYQTTTLNTGGVGNNTPSTFGVTLWVRSSAGGDFWAEGTWAATG